MRDEGSNSSLILHPSSLIMRSGSKFTNTEFCMERFSALIGFVVILAIAIGLSNNRRAIRWRTVMWGLILQILTAIAVLNGELIAQWLSAIALPITHNIVAILFIARTIVLHP